MRGAWIEISDCIGEIYFESSLPVRGAWIEILYQWGVYITANASLPVRGAWIEITPYQIGN